MSGTLCSMHSYFLFPHTQEQPSNADLCCILDRGKAPLNFAQVSPEEKPRPYIKTKDNAEGAAYSDPLFFLRLVAQFFSNLPIELYLVTASVRPIAGTSPRAMPQSLLLHLSALCIALLQAQAISGVCYFNMRAHEDGRVSVDAQRRHTNARMLHAVCVRFMNRSWG